MAEFEFMDNLQKPFKNKKLKPIMIAGVIIVVAVVLYQKGSTGNGQSTEYIGTYAGNTGATTEVSNMMEGYKETFQTMLDDNQAATNEQVLLYMDELNKMFDSKMTAFDDEYDKSIAALEKTLTERMDNQYDTMRNNISIIRNQQELSQQRQEQNALENQLGYVKSYYDNPNNNLSKSYEDFNVTNGRESNYFGDGTAYITAGLLDMLGDMHGGSGSSSSDFSKHSTKYYYEDSQGNVSKSYINDMNTTYTKTGSTTNINYADGTSSKVEKTSSNSDYTSKYDGSKVSSSLVETVTTRPDGTRLVTYSRK